MQQAIGTLLSFSLIRKSVGADRFSVHPLIHLWARLRLRPLQQEAVLKATLTMMYEFSIHTGCARNYWGESSHVLHLYSIYTHSTPFACTNPEQYITPSDSWDESDIEDFFNLYPHFKKIQDPRELSHARSLGVTWMRWSRMGYILEPSDQSFMVREVTYWTHLMYCISGFRDGNKKDFEDFRLWSWCRGTMQLSGLPVTH